MSTQNSNYEKVLKELTQSGITETPFSWFALAIGIIAKGVEPGSRIYNNVFSNLLNDNQPLPGAVVATLTNLGLDIKDKLDNASQDLFCFPDTPHSFRHGRGLLFPPVLHRSSGSAWNNRTGRGRSSQGIKCIWFSQCVFSHLSSFLA